MIWLWILIVVVVLIVLYIIGAFNSFIRTRNLTRNAWAQIDVHLKRRANLIPNIVKTVKGYAKHEMKVFTDVTKLRTEYLSAGTVEEKIKADDALTRCLKNLFAVAENYPKLVASKNFEKLQEELSKTEDKIAYMREFYNDTVYKYNVRIQVFPANVVATLFGFKELPLFKLEETRTVPQVTF